MVCSPFALGKTRHGDGQSTVLEMYFLLLIVIFPLHITLNKLLNLVILSGGGSFGMEEDIIGLREHGLRIYLLYTGQHYDPIVSGNAADVAVEQEQKRQKKGAPMWWQCSFQVRTGSKLVATTVDGRNLFTQFIMVQEFFRQQYHGNFQIHFKGNCSPICKLWAVDKGNEAVRRVLYATELPFTSKISPF